MNASCESSIHNYRCGSPELITLFEILGSLDGVHGTRFSGAGYGGCCLALVDPAQEERISRVTEERYLAAFPSRREGFETFSCTPSGGAEVL
jgi:galactokinase/galacturonokinase